MDNNFTGASRSSLKNPDKVTGASNNGDRKKLEAVVSSESTKIKKKSKWERIKEAFIAEDGTTVSDYLIFDVLVPAAKDTLLSLINNGASMLINGNNYRNNGYNGLPNSRTSYAKIYGQTNYSNNYSGYAKPRLTSGYEYDEILFESRGDAEAVLWKMNEIATEYQFVRVADYVELSGRTSRSFTDNNYGWSIDAIRNVSIRLNTNPRGYYLELPKPMEIGN